VPVEGDLRWGGLRASGDLLIATLFRPQDLADAQAGFDGNGGDWAGDRMPMSHLIAIDRRTGKLAWSRRANWGFLNRSGISTGGGKVFCVDLITDGVHAKWKEARREFPASSPTLYALDMKTGEEAWSFPLDVYVQNIVYSEPRDVLIAPCRNLKEWRDGKWVDLSIDIRRGNRDKNAAGKWRALRGKDGSVVWEMAEAAYHSPHIVLGDLIIDRSGVSYDLTTGRRHLRVSSSTGKQEEWSFKKAGCNHLIACENLVTWRCAYYDLATHNSKTLTGMDAGCSPTLIPAGGVLSIPNFGTHHKRNRMTAMALVHRENAQ
jgi:outer membrane protein assembly factor BamB